MLFSIEMLSFFPTRVGGGIHPSMCSNAAFPFPEHKRMPQRLPRGKWFVLPVWYDDGVYKKPKHTRSILSLVMETTGLS